MNVFGILRGDWARGWDWRSERWHYLCLSGTIFLVLLYFKGPTVLFNYLKIKTVTDVDKEFVEVVYDIHFSVPKIYVKSSFGFWACFLCLKMRLHLEC